MSVRLKEHYTAKVMPDLVKEFGYKNPMSIPQIVKIVLNVGLGEGATNVRLLDQSLEELSAITGQKGVITRAKKSIANFKLREGMPIGTRVTLRSARMYEFLDRFISITLPRIADFRGISRTAFDGRGNYTLGVKEQLIFTEISYDKVENVRGMNVTIVTTAKTDKEAMALLTGLGLPFQKEGETRSLWA